MGGHSCVATWELITGANMTSVVCRRWAVELIFLKSPPWIGGGGGRRTLDAYELFKTL